ncbi:hypothetical protein OENI_10084 [Oenococcus oeni]|uniref:hypothetical protein n=1 Tax=Oenococcus oeni TaxID=1247 RepID=UPI0010B49EED|nr:hypothetical protein [Oenococcus oeni]SYW00383.1 hypothetical protein OENI_10084 [Oenococcus oeni]SYW07222.1 hypothetical protein OENI_10064 [Oenococcus oeni]
MKSYVRNFILFVAGMVSESALVSIVTWDWDLFWNAAGAIGTFTAATVALWNANQVRKIVFKTTVSYTSISLVNKKDMVPFSTQALRLFFSNQSMLLVNISELEIHEFNKDNSAYSPDKNFSFHIFADETVKDSDIYPKEHPEDAQPKLW